eukprot:Gb_29445 [translate_table: standard]
MAGRLIAGRSIRRFLSPLARSITPFLSLQDASSDIVSHFSRSDGILSHSAIECSLPFAVRTPSIRLFSSDISALPPVTDTDVKYALRDLMAADWEEIHDSIKSDVMNALSKETDDKDGQEALANAWRAAEAVEHFCGVLVSLRMELDEISGGSGENVRPLSDELQGALQAVYKRYTAYLDAFGPDEVYLKKKVEMELGTRMIHIKMRCSGLDSDWGKITILGTSGLSGSYIEHRSA